MLNYLHRCQLIIIYQNVIYFYTVTTEGPSRIVDRVDGFG
jgi:hypothetical protein